jgi:hypothetical protein
MRRGVWVLGVLALVVSLGILAADICEYCQSSPSPGTWVHYYQCKNCYTRYCDNCEVQVDGWGACPKCKSKDRVEVGQLRGY